MFTGSAAHTTSYPVDTGAVSLGVKSRCVKLTIHLHLVPRSRMVEVYLHLHGIVLNAVLLQSELLHFG
jgi:hypothetical protein